MHYEEALAFLRGREQFRVKDGTRNIRATARALGHPERRVPAVVVAGTNGKGSTVALLDALLRAHGLRVGRFTSPHLVEIGERIHLDGRQISPEEFADCVGAVARAAETLPGERQPSFFESVTAAAFVAFARHRLDAALFEVGMGGRWDATTATDAPLGLVTRIALDHERHLGRTVAGIAGEKGAIARRGGELLVAPQDPAARRVLEASARSAGARFHDLDEEVEAVFEFGRTGASGRLRTPAAAYDDLWLPLPGRHQADNLALAVRGAERLFSRLGLGAPDPERVKRGIARARWRGRLEWLPPSPGRPAILLDAAHNPDGAERLADYLGALETATERALVFGAMRDKRVGEMLAPLAPLFGRVVLTAAGSQRAFPLPGLREAAGRVLPAERLEVVAGVPEALERAFRIAGPRGEAVVAGSIFLLGDALDALGPVARPAPEPPFLEIPEIPPDAVLAPGLARRSPAA